MTLLDFVEKKPYYNKTLNYLHALRCVDIPDSNNINDGTPRIEECL